MVHAFAARRDFVAGKLRSIPGVKLAEPQGAFYVLPEMSAFFGPGAEAKGFGAVPDSDTFCRRAPAAWRFIVSAVIAVIAGCVYFTLVRVRRGAGCMFVCIWRTWMAAEY